MIKKESPSSLMSCQI